MPRSAESFSVHADEFHQVPGFVAVADRRIFAVMAFLNAVGYNDEAHGMQMTPLRLKVRQMVAANLEDSPEKLARWQRQYASYVRARILLPAYQDYGLRLSPDYPFRPVFPIPHKKLSRLHETLNDFWRRAKLNAVWEAVKPDYMAEVRSYNRQIDSLMGAGFLLLRPFYDLLGSFEASDLPFDRFVPQLFEKTPSYRR